MCDLFMNYVSREIPNDSIQRTKIKRFVDTTKSVRVCFPFSTLSHCLFSIINNTIDESDKKKLIRQIE